MIGFLPEGVEAYCDAHSTPENNLMTELAQVTREKTAMPEMQVGHLEGMFLKVMTRAIDAKHVVEIGTFTGYSTLMFAEAVGEGGHVTTCDIDPQATAIAQEFWDRSAVGDRITLRLGDALATLDTIDEPIDLVFIDADKENYIRYWDKVVPMVRSGGLLLCDNVLWGGTVMAPDDELSHALAEFNRHVVADERVDIAMLTVRDGISVACKR